MGHNGILKYGKFNVIIPNFDDNVKWYYCHKFVPYILNHPIAIAIAIREKTFGLW